MVFMRFQNDIIICKGAKEYEEEEKQVDCWWMCG